MKVLLIQDVDNLGYAGDVKKVANGFGRNYLLPQNLAVLATPGTLKQAETIRKAAEKRRAQETEDAQAIANQLQGLELIFERRAGETGKLYGSVTSSDIAEAILGKTQIDVDRRKVSLHEPIRNLGRQEVTIKLMIDVSTQIKVDVVPLGGILERERLSEAEVAEIEAEMEETTEVKTEIDEEAEIEANMEEAIAILADMEEMAGVETETVEEAEQPSETDEEEAAG